MSEPEHISTILARVIEGIADLQGEAEGWRRRNLILDSQLEALQQITARQKAHLAIMEEIIRLVPDGDAMTHRINRLTESILKQARLEVGGDDSGAIEELFR